MSAAAHTGGTERSAWSPKAEVANDGLKLQNDRKDVADVSDVNCRLEEGRGLEAASPSRSARTPWSRQSSGSDFFNGGSGDSADEGLASEESTLTFKDVSFSVRTSRGAQAKEKVILAPVSGHFEPGSLVAVMGPSGSGKTTLVDILADKKTSPYSGTVHFNGRPRDKLFARMTSYVPQNDVMPAYLTVKEAVLFHTALKTEWPRGFTGAHASKLMEKRLKMFGLYEIRDSYIGDSQVRGISGGQRRRLSLARGIASGARLLFCDEPTSGLSSTDAEACVRYMRHVADKLRTTIVVVIHQPRIEVAEMFDHLLLLTAKPGRTVYNGPMADAVAHFEKVIGAPMPPRMNPMDFCMDLVTPEARGSCEEKCVKYYIEHCRPDLDKLVAGELENKRAEPLEMLEAWQRKMLRYGDLPPVRNSKYGVRFRRQLQIVFRRQLTLCFRDKQGVWAELIVAVVKALVVGLAYLDVGELGAPQQVGFFFMLLMSCSIEGMKNMPKVIGDRTIMKSEVADALYSEWAYIFSFTIINWVQQFISNALFVVVIFLMSGLSWELFGITFLWTSLLSVTMDSMYLMVAAIAKDSASSFVISLPFLMVFLLYNGFTATRKTVPPFMTWAIEISPVAYAMEAMVNAASQVYVGGLYPVLIDTFGYVEEPVRAVEVLCAGFLLFRFVQIVCLKKLNNIQR